MKTTYKFFNQAKAMLFAGALSIMLFSCQTSNRAVTRDDVVEDIEEANEATREAQEKTQQAIEIREQYSADTKAAKIEGLEERMESIEERISTLRETAKNSQNNDAVSNINAAISNLEDERAQLMERINQVKAIESEDWSNSFDEVDQAVQRIEAELEKLSESVNP